MTIAYGAGAATGSPGTSTPPDKRLAVQVARRLEDEIVDRRWPVGEVLGSETELRERFGVSRSVLREAIRLLEHQSVVTMRRGPGGGLVVSAPDASPATRALVIYLEYVGTSVEDLLRARLLLEPLAARLAAESVTEDGIDLLRAVVSRETDRSEGPARFSGDEFHVALGRLSGNVVLQLFTEVLIRLTFRYADASQETPRDPGASARHLEIVEVVTAGDGAAAQTCLTAHLHEVEGWLSPHQVRPPSEPMRTRPTDPDPEPAGLPGRKLAEIVASRLHGDITSDGRQVGEVLGSEAELLVRYGVSRAVLREAIRILEHHSVAQMRRGPGGGLVILAPDPTASIHTMALYLDYQGLRPEHLRVVREAIELGCIQAVTAAVPSPAAPSSAALAVEARLRAALDRDTGQGGELFHTELAELAGNPVLTLFLRIVTELWARQGRGEPPPDPAVRSEIREVHQKILDAVLAGDEGLAQHRMRRHLQSLTTWWH